MLRFLRFQLPASRFLLPASRTAPAAPIPLLVPFCLTPDGTPLL